MNGLIAHASCMSALMDIAYKTCSGAAPNNSSANNDGSADQWKQ